MTPPHSGGIAQDPADDDVLVRFMLDSPGLIDALLDEHVPDQPCGSIGARHCKVCPGAHTGRPVWPCDIHRAATRADGIRKLREEAGRSTERFLQDAAREGVTIRLDGKDRTSGPPVP